MYQQLQVNQLPVLCAAFGVQHVVVSPGSRSAPLTLAFSRSGLFDIKVVTDERSAAFIALGMAQQTRVPVVLICTSGTAAVNYFPAVAEAFFQKVPLLILTADRPPELVGQQDGQTIFQTGVFGQHVKASLTLPHTYAENTTAHIEVLQQALAACCYPDAGPVHVNVPLREPLYATEFVFEEVSTTKPEMVLPPPDVTLLEQSLQQAERVLVVCAALPAQEFLHQRVKALLAKSSVVWINDVCANLRGTGDVMHYDFLLGALNEEQLHLLRPQLLITLGDNHVSKNLKQFLKRMKPERHFHFSPSASAPDTFQTSPVHIQADVFSLLHVLEQHHITHHHYLETWQQLEAQASTQWQQFSQAAPFGELKAVDTLLKQLPAGAQVQLANSMSVRYTNYFATRSDCTFYSNRGTSGIDGSTSTAVGAAVVSKQPVFLLTGDVAFFYDDHAFWNNFVPDNLTVVVLNNNGGGIFRLIDGPRDLPEREHLFTTPPQRSVKDVAEHYGLHYLCATDEATLVAAIQQRTGILKPHIIEVVTHPSTDMDVFTAFKHIRLN